MILDMVRDAFYLSQSPQRNAEVKISKPKDRPVYSDGLFLKSNGHGMKEKMNSFIFFFKPIPIFNPNFGIEACIAGL